MGNSSSTHQSTKRRGSDPQPKGRRGKARSSTEALATEPASVPVTASPEPATPSRAPTFGQRVKAVMAEKGLTQTVLAQKTGIERSEINRTLNDKRNPRPDEINWIAAALGIKLGDLMEGVQLPANLHRAIEQTEFAAKRVLQAEGERDEARGQLRALQQSLLEERSASERARSAQEEAHRRERRQLGERISALEAALRNARTEIDQAQERHALAMAGCELKASEEVTAARSDAAQREAALRSELSALHQLANATAGKLAMSDARVRAQAKQIADLQQMATGLQEESKKEKGRLLFTGLLGSFLGVALGAGAASSRDDE